MVNPAEDADFVRPPSNWLKFGKIGDTFKGKLVNKYQKDDAFHPGEKQWVYELEAESGSYHNIVEKAVDANATEIVPGETYSVSGKKIIDNVMQKCAIGQRAKMTYTGDFTKDAKTSKTISVLLDSKFVKTEDAPF